MTKVKSINRTARMTVKLLLRRVATSVISMLVGLTGIATSANAAELNIYSHRQQFLLQPFLDAFTAETGITTNVVYASKGLAQRLKAEGEASPADVILTVDIARLSEYADLDLLSPCGLCCVECRHPERTEGIRQSMVRIFNPSEACGDVEGARCCRCHF